VTLISKNMIEFHPLPPFFPKGAKILMLGSFPPPKVRWKMNFFYPNLQNDMWRIFGLIFFRDKNHFLAEGGKTFNEPLLRTFLSEKGFALWDTAMEIIRQQGNASDKFLEVIRPIALKDTLDQLPECKSIVLTGQKATDILTNITGCDEPQVGGYITTVYHNRPLRIYRMPSSSRAYPKSLEEKASVYEKMFRELDC
jgi:G:T/U-mismatch repair DNA glycosylase